MDLKSELDIPTSIDKFVKNGEITIKILMSNERWFGVTIGKINLLLWRVSIK